mmetsp:Transcript_19961/g.30707  ORF Transcript_19961/g.30707 Transcript_19961/m.30707 type:complete len:89 (+) Transcript_19961:58-324(+)
MIRRIITNIDKTSEKAELDSAFKEVSAALDSVVDLCESLIGENQLLNLKLKERDQEIEKLQTLIENSNLLGSPKSPQSPTPNFQYLLK